MISAIFTELRKILLKDNISYSSLQSRITDFLIPTQYTQACTRTHTHFNKKPHYYVESSNNPEQK